MNRHPATMSRDEVLAELRSLNPRATSQAGDQVATLSDEDLRELLVIARRKNWKADGSSQPSDWVR